MNVLTIQSHVAYGHVGNAAAVFPLQRLGFEAWAVHSVQFSNHTGYGAWRGEVFSADLIREVVTGIDERGVLASCDGILSGYIGDAAIGEAVLDAVARVKAVNPKAIYCCDPVMGDVGRGVFVRPGIPEFMQSHLVPAADAVTPNQFELELLTGRTIRTLDDALQAAEMVRGRGPGIVVVTSLVRHDAPAGSIECLVSTVQGAWLVTTPMIPLDPPPNGAGDALAALFLGHYLRSGDAAAALARAVSGLHGVLRVTEQEGTREIQLIRGQDHLVAPSVVFEARKVL